MKRTLWKFSALIAVISLITVFIVSCDSDPGIPEYEGLFNAGSGSGVLFDIRSPYQNVNWDTYGQFKAANHVHTLNSDGSSTMEQQLMAHYNLDYDIITITDHVWRDRRGEDPEGAPARPYLNLVTKSVTQSTWAFGGYTMNLTHISQARKLQFETGTIPAGETTRTVDRGMLIIPGTAELAPGGDPTPDEVNVFFWPDDVLAPNAWAVQLRAGIQRVHNAEAVGFINHPGRSTHAMSFPVGAANAVDPENPSNQGRWIRRYANLMMEFPIDNITGLEIFNRRDVDSRHDRVLWDNVNKLTIPEGRFVWGYGNDDLHSHSVSATGNGLHINYNVFVMPENSYENFRYALVNGHSYIVTVAAFNEGVNQPSTSAASARPAISQIIFDKNADTIAIIARNATRVVWISDGVEILTTTGTNSFIDLADPDIIDNVGSFVRANIIGPAGMAVTQPISTRRK